MEEIIGIPLSALVNQANFREGLQLRDGELVPVYSYEYKGKVIWGATARILKQLVELVRGEWLGRR